MTITPLSYQEFFWAGKILGTSRCYLGLTYLLLKVSCKYVSNAEESRERLFGLNDMALPKSIS